MKKIMLGSLVAACCCIAGWLAAGADFRFSNIRPVTNREVELTLGGGTGLTYRIETSSNLNSWTPLITMPAASSLLHTDTAAPYLSNRVYRAQQLSDTNILTGDHLATTNGDVVIHPFRHAGFVMSWQGKIIYNDPTNRGVAFPGLPKADLILISHMHGDHFEQTTIEAVRGPNCVIIAPQAVYNAMTSAVQRAITTVQVNGSTTNVYGIRIDSIPAWNSNHPQGSGNGYVLTIGGKRIYICGDTGVISEMTALTNIDVAFMCMNQFVMTVAEAATATRQFRPKVVYPYHFRISTTSFSDLSDFKRRVGQDLGIEVRLRQWY